MLNKERFIGPLMAMTAPAMSMITTPKALPGKYEREKYSFKMCRLPGCMEMTDHPGGFCCAEHCRLARRKL